MAAALSSSSKLLIAAGIAGTAGLAYGAHAGTSAADTVPQQDRGDRAPLVAHSMVAMGLTSAGLGAAVYAALRLVGKKTGMGAAKRVVGGYTRSLGNAFRERSFAGVLSHGVAGLTVGGAVGGLLAHHFSDGDPGATGKGLAVGGLVGLTALPVASQLTRSWKSLETMGPAVPRLVDRVLGRKTTWHPVGKSLKVGALLGLGVSAAAWAQASAPPEYESAAAAVPDAGFDYTYGPTLSERLAAMNGTGDVVLGLHNGRH